MIKAIFFDIDGTLVSFNTHKVPDSAREALEALRRKGIKIFIATGRHISSINNLPDLVFDGFVLINGTLVMTCPKGGATAVEMANPELLGREIIYEKPIPKEDISHWLDMINKEARSTVFVYEKNLTINFVDKTMGEIMNLLNFPHPTSGDLQKLKDTSIFQIITSMKDEEEAEIMQHLPHCKTTRWHPLFTDIINRDASKACGIRALMDYYGWKREEIMAIGDGGNDIDMLDLAGIAVVMGNASEEVKSHADFITESVDNNGIKLAMEHFSLI
ncbi:MAG: Cof-type HAD-IIB family hydrolase [Bacteroidales bacterium]|nr:Cof-type HAD-IIB family hydrolase [Bacteroidales bacterium]